MKKMSDINDFMRARDEAAEAAYTLLERLAEDMIANAAYDEAHIRIYDQKSSIPRSIPLVDPNGSTIWINPTQNTSP